MTTATVWPLLCWHFHTTYSYNPIAMISPLEAFAAYNVPVTGLLHIGANTAAEAHEYSKIGPVPVIFFEPIPSVAAMARNNTRNYPSMTVVEICCSDRDDEQVTFNVASNNGQSSSMLAPGAHERLYPSIEFVDKLTLKTKRVDTFLADIPESRKFNCAVIDTQGADKRVLEGFGSRLDDFDGLYVEASDQPLYDGGATLRDVQEFLHARGFAFIHFESTPMLTYGNALFIRRSPAYEGTVRNAISVGKRAYQSSTYHNNQEYAAVRGNDGIIDRGKFFHTEIEDNPWWHVDLGKDERLRGIYIFERPGYRDRSSRLIIELSSNGRVYKPVFTRQSITGVIGQSYFVQLDDSARYVRVRIEDKGCLHLCQVAVV